MVHEAAPVASRDSQTVQLEDPLNQEPTPDHGDSVTVISGAHLQHFPLAGMPVAQARALLGQVMSLHPEAPAVVNGQSVDGAYALEPGDMLEFVHHAGEKGCGLWNGA
jgi:hypothetical protein